MSNALGSHREGYKVQRFVTLIKKACVHIKVFKIRFKTEFSQSAKKNFIEKSPTHFKHIVTFFFPSNGKASCRPQDQDIL